MKKYILILLLFLNSCVGSSSGGVFGTGVSVALDPRTLGTQIDDSIMQKNLVARLTLAEKAYFVKMAKMNSLISTNDVINTNNGKISVCNSKYKDKAIIISSIDNLIKGGAGQAIQNMNILNDFKINEGLK